MVLLLFVIDIFFDMTSQQITNILNKKKMHYIKGNAIVVATYNYFWSGINKTFSIGEIGSL